MSGAVLSSRCSGWRTFVIAWHTQFEQAFAKRCAGTHDSLKNSSAERDERGGFGCDRGQAPTTVSEQRAASKMIAGTECPHHRARGIAQFDPSGFHHVKRERWLARVEDGIARLEMNVLERLSVAWRDQRNVAWEEKIERPVDHHAQLAIE